MLRRDRRLKSWRRIFDALMISSLALIAMLIKALSTNWPLAVSEFDPWYLFYNAILIANSHGNWYAVLPDVKSWFPWGYNIELGNTIGLPALIAWISLLAFGKPTIDGVFTVTLFMDIALAGFSVLASYLATYTITKNKIAGYIASAIIAVSPALTYKNLVGGLPKTSWGAMFILFAVYLLNEGIEKNKAYYSVLAGVLLFLAEISWGGYIYVNLSLVLAVFLLILLKKNSESISKNYTLMAITTAFLTSLAPNNIGFMSGLAHGLIMLLASLILYLDLYAERVIPSEIKESKSLLIGGLLVLVFLLATLSMPLLKLSNPIPARYYAIINPFFQYSVPIDRTVAEYIPESVVGMIQSFGVWLFLYIIGVYAIFRMPRFVSLWVLALSVLGVLGTSEQPYLFNYTIYMIAISTGIGIAYILSLLDLNKRGHRLMGILLISLSALSLLADASASVVASNIPPAIYNAATVYNTVNYAWISATNWIKTNTPQNSLVMSWWDYGYWLGVLTDRYTIDANNTLNGTQIRFMAEIFLNNESYAVNILEKYFHLYPYGSPNATMPVYIVAYDAVTLVQSSKGLQWYLGYPPHMPGPFLGYTTSLGDIAKAIGAMTIIARYNQSDYVDFNLIISKINETINTYAYANPQFAQYIISEIENSEPFAWTPKTYNSLIASMFIEALQVSFPGIQVVAPLSNPPAPLPPITLTYFKPVYVALYPLTSGGNTSYGGTYTVYIMVIVYQFSLPS